MSKISLYRVVAAWIVAKTAFLIQLELSSEDRHFKSILTEISTFILVTAYIIPEPAFLCQYEVCSSNRQF